MRVWRFSGIWKKLFVGIAMSVLPVTAIAGELTGTAIYRERIALPAEAKFQAVLYEISGADRIEIGRFDGVGSDGPPYAFVINYPDEVVSNTNQYVVEAKIVWPDAPFFTAEASVEASAIKGPSIELIMKRSTGSETEARGANTQRESEVEQKPMMIGAHGLRLPQTFRGKLRDNERSEAWQLSLWPNQTFQLVRDFGDGHSRSSLGLWKVDPSTQSIFLRDGSEMPLVVSVTPQGNLQVIDPNANTVRDGDLESTGDIAMLELKNMLISGMMISSEGVSELEVCQTGIRFPISQEGAYQELEQAYLENRIGAGEPLYVMLEGSLLMRDGIDGLARQTVVVDRFLRIRQNVTCERQKADAHLENTYWRLDVLEGVSFPQEASEKEPHLVLVNGDARGYRATIGCNLMRGSYDTQNDQLSFGAGIATLMACPPPLDQLERSFGMMLASVASYAIEGETLVLKDDEDQTRAIFTAVYF